MLTTTQRIRTYAGAIMLAIIILGVFFGFTSQQRLADIRTLNEARNFSYALERYRQDFWRYPAATNIDVRRGVILSENGFAPGSHVYYRGGIPSSRVATYRGDDTTYAVNFTLRRSWPEQGLVGTKCTIVEYYKLQCTK